MFIYKLTCPSCASHLKATKPVPAGKVVKCPKCNNHFAVPAPAINLPAAKAEEANSKKRKAILICSLVGSAAMVLGVGLSISWMKVNSVLSRPPIIEADAPPPKIAQQGPPKEILAVQPHQASQQSEPPKGEPKPKPVRVDQAPKQTTTGSQKAAEGPSMTVTSAPQPVTPPTKEDGVQVLVPGKPPLTQDFLDQLTNYGEWLLDLQLTGPQRHEWQQLFVNSWKKVDQATKDRFCAYFEAQLKRIQEIAKLTDAQRNEIRAQQQPLFLTGLRKWSGQEDRLLLRLYESAHQPGGERNPILVAGTPPLAQDTVDKWRRFSEWILDVEMTEQQRRQFQRRLVNDWKKLDQAAKDSFFKEITEGLPSQLPLLNNYYRNLLRAQRQTQFLASLQQSSANESSRWLLDVYKATHTPGGERNRKLVSGNPPLTQGIVSQYGDFIEWILALKLSGGLSAPQRQDLQQVLMSDWQKMDQSEKDKFLQLLKRWNAVVQLNDAARSRYHEELQPKFLTQLLNAPDHEPSRWLLEIYDREQKLIRLYTKEVQSQTTPHKKSSG